MHNVQKVLISIVSIALQRESSRLTSLFWGSYKTNNLQPGLFFRSGKHQKSPSVIPFEFESPVSPETLIENDLVAETPDEVVPDQEPLDFDSSEEITEIEITKASPDANWGEDPIAEELELEDVLEDLTTDDINNSQKPLTSDKEETDNVEAVGAEGEDGSTVELADDGISEVAIAEDADPVVEDTVDSELEDAIAEDPDSVAEDIDDSEDDSEDVAEENDEETELASTETNPDFTSGVFTVGDSGEVTVDFLFDGGKYKGELAIFSLDGMDEFEPGSEEFIREAADRALSNSTSGYVVISDQNDAAKISGELGDKDYNSGDYLGAKTFTMQAGDEFGFMLVANGRVQQVFDNPDVGGALRPLFSMATANPEDAFHVGQIADVTGDGNTFVMEDMQVDGGSDRDYNDIIFQVRGATSTAISLDEVIDSAKDWRTTDLGQELIDYVESEIVDTPDSEDDNEFSPPLEIVDTLPVDPLTGVEYIPGSMMLKFDSTATEAEILAFAQSQGAIAVENLFEQQTVVLNK